MGEATSLPNPCTLVSDDEINQMLAKAGTPFKVAGKTFTPFPDIGGGQCDIDVKNDGGSSSFAFSVSPSVKGSLFIEPGTRKPIPGMGDEAFEVRMNYYANVKGVLLHVVNFPGERQSGAAAMLRAAIAKL